VDVIILTTATPDRSRHRRESRRHSARRAPPRSTSAACSGFIHAIQVARGLFAGSHETAIVISAEKMSAIVDGRIADLRAAR
jgi:3-oxoacyl-[acyl-carrier-protein] synthase III